MATKYKTIYPEKPGGVLPFTLNDESKVSGGITLIYHLLNVYLAPQCLAIRDLIVSSIKMAKYVVIK